MGRPGDGINLGVKLGFVAHWLNWIGFLKPPKRA